MKDWLAFPLALPIVVLLLAKTRFGKRLPNVCERGVQVSPVGFDFRNGIGSRYYASGRVYESGSTPE